MERSTVDALLRELKETKDLAAFLERNHTSFLRKTVAQGLSELFLTRSISKAELARRADVSLVYLHQVFGGRRMPSRDRLLGLCLGLHATLEETQYLLQLAVYAPLCPLYRRDAIFIYGLFRQMTLDDIRETMTQFDEPPLY